MLIVLEDSVLLGGEYANRLIIFLLGAGNVILHGFFNTTEVYIWLHVPLTKTNGATLSPYLQLYTRVTLVLTSKEDTFRKNENILV